jgi:kojibiose phosphorylase
MKMIFQKLLNNKEWLIERDGFDLEKINYYETILTIGNGYLGTRGSLEDGHRTSLPGTFLNGVFDDYDAFVIDLVNAPDWTVFHFYVEGQRVNLQTCKVLKHHWKLDISQGVLFRYTQFEDIEGRITDFESVRYASLADRHLMEMRVSITAVNYAGKITVVSGVDGQVLNLDRTALYRDEPAFHPDVKWKKWTKSKHLKQIASSQNEEGLYLEMHTLDRPHTIGYATKTSLVGRAEIFQPVLDYEQVFEKCELSVKEGEAIVFEKLVSIFTSRDVAKSEVKNNCLTFLQKNKSLSFEDRIKANQTAWLEKWEKVDCTIDGDEKVTQALRYNIYHLLITANEFDEKANIGAKSLSGEGYRGHVFWDTEIFMLPFYIYTQPATAKALLLYRYHTLPGAREYAISEGQKGARYAWESADTGHEVTPKWTADGEERIWTGEEELHITAAVVYGVLTYYTATNDDEFLNDYGLEILFDTARFWASRLEYNAEEDRYELSQVQGPDEFHQHVNNSVYNNYLAKWNLEKATSFFGKYASSDEQVLKAVVSKIGITKEDLQSWEIFAKKIYIPFDAEKNIIEQFEGYFQLKDPPIIAWDENNMPKYPEGYDHVSCNETTLLKQPDILMLLYILPDQFSDEIKKANYDFYEPRTMHKSSLSPSIHSIMGIEIGNTEKALQYFERSAYVDLVDNQGNTEWGMHIASAGGTWQAVVFGFGGMRVKNGQLHFKPWLPDNWNSTQFKIQWQKGELQVDIQKGNINFIWNNTENTPIHLVVNGTATKIPAHKKVGITT